MMLRGPDGGHMRGSFPFLRDLMAQNFRHSEILTIAREAGKVTVEGLATHFNVTAPWRGWVLPHTNEVAGHVTEWDGGAWSYVTIRGSGHMVPEFKSAAALAMMTSFISNTPLSRYVPPQLLSEIV